MATSSSRLALAAVAGFAVVAAGCDLTTPWTSEYEAPVYACDEAATMGTCVEHGRLSPESIDYGQGYCESRQGLWLVNEPCPAADRFGSCDWAARGGGIQYFYANCTWCDGIEASCTGQGGAWTPYP